ncbi:MAG TPA: transposase [Burkholderiales bacterium]|nr:transposase [Burkholderiales bacterium]
MWPSCHAHAFGVTLHVIQRGYARAACFFSERDRHAYVYFLRGYAERCACALHAYVLMANHVHLLVTPARAGALAELMHALGARYARHVLQAHGQPGPLWEERFEAAPVHTRRYVLSCMTYIELNPVRACLVARPEAYRWSSYRANALGEDDPLLTPHAFYCALGRSPEVRRAAYRALFRVRAARLPVSR